MITKEQATTLPHGTVLYHIFARNADGTPARGRINGKCKTWKTRPTEFRLPMKHGLFDYFYINEKVADEWFLTEEEALAIEAAKFEPTPDA